MKEAMVCMIFSCGAMYASTSSSFSEGSLSYSGGGADGKAVKATRSSSIALDATKSHPSLTVKQAQGIMKDKCAKVNTLQWMESMISFDRKRMSKGAAACMVMCVLVVFSGAIMSWCSFTLTLTLCSVLMLLCGSVGINLVSWKATKGFSKEEARMFRKLVAAELECILS